MEIGHIYNLKYQHSQCDRFLESPAVWQHRQVTASCIFQSYFSITVNISILNLSTSLNSEEEKTGSFCYSLNTKTKKDDLLSFLFIIEDV